MKARTVIATLAFLMLPATALAAPDLIVQSITLDPAGAEYDSGTINIVFANVGPDDVNLSFTEYTNYTVALNGVECDASFIGDLDAGATNAESTGSCNPDAPGTYDITVTIDSDFDVSESNEGNNVLTVSFTWGGPDLVITNITLDPTSPPINEGTLQATIENIGAYGTATFLNIDITMYLDGVECDTGIIIAGLGAGSTTTENTTSCNPTTPGVHTIRFEVDTTGEVPEVNENNNSFETTFTWQGPDLIVQSITLDPSSPDVSSGDLEATFTNVGQADVDLPLNNFTNYRVLLDGVECDTGFISDLAVGETNVESISNNCLPDTPNDHTITVEIDSDGDVGETDESNNSLSETFTWGGPDLVITGIVLEPTVPEVGDGKLTATVENIGQYGTDILLNIDITMYLDGVECDTGIIIAGLGAGSTTTEETTSCNPSTPGVHTIRFEVDTTSEVPELDETNNSFETTFTWTDGNCSGPELCNGLDDDCDGDTDEDFMQQLGQTCTIPDCTNDGTFSCAPDGTVACTTNLTDDDEICDGEDNDCDGQIDEVWTELDTACTAGVGACEASGVYVCNAAQDDIECDAVPLPTAGVETCDNGVDDDCDGSTDEDCGCEPGETQDCGTDVGVCMMGSQACVNGVFSETCSGEVPPGEEICDSLDNDCDGDVDEGCNCDDPGAEPCPAGTSCNTTTGACDPDTGPADNGGGTPDEAQPDAGPSEDTGSGTPDTGGNEPQVDGGQFTVPDSGVATNPNALNDDEGCAGGAGGGGSPMALWLLALGLLIAVRRRVVTTHPH